MNGYGRRSRKLRNPMAHLSTDENRPRVLYKQWERQHWSAHDIDFTQDRRDWLSISDRERWQWYWLGGFAHFRQTEMDVMVSMARLLPVLPHPDHQVFLGTQIADEARHVYFFNRFHSDVLDLARPQDEVKPSALYQRVVADLPLAAVVKASTDPTAANIACAALHVFVVLEGAIALASFSVVRRLLMRVGLFPGLLEGMSYAQRDEVRHAQFGVALLQYIFREDPSARDAAANYLRDIIPLLDALTTPQAGRTAVLQSLGLDPMARRRKIYSLLRRHLGVVGLREAAGDSITLAA